MYTVKVRKRYAELHKTAVLKLAAAFGVPVDSKPAKVQQGKVKHVRRTS